MLFSVIDGRGAKLRERKESGYKVKGKRKKKKSTGIVEWTVARDNSVSM